MCDFFQKLSSHLQLNFSSLSLVIIFIILILLIIIIIIIIFFLNFLTHGLVPPYRGPSEPITSLIQFFFLSRKNVLLIDPTVPHSIKSSLFLHVYDSLNPAICGPSLSLFQILKLGASYSSGETIMTNRVVHSSLPPRLTFPPTIFHTTAVTAYCQVGIDSTRMEKHFLKIHTSFSSHLTSYSHI